MTRLLRIFALVCLLGGVALNQSQAQPPPKQGAKAKFRPFPKAIEKPAGSQTADKPATDKAPTADQIAFFEKSIRPVLVKECYECHALTAKEIKGGLTLDTRDGLRNGGETGPAIVPGSPSKSLLLAAIKHTNPERAMPPKKKLPAEVIADFERWISMGAPDPRDGDGRIAAKPSKYEIDIEKGRKFWSFQPVKKVSPPAVKDAAWPKSDIDR